jgi:pimeloyl-ACP methyl ester carboxylesterase
MMLAKPSVTTVSRRGWLLPRRAKWLLGGLVLPLLLGAAAPPEEEKKDGEKDEVPAAEDITLTTADGVQLAATYWPGTKKKEHQKETVPVVLLHAWKGSRHDYKDLATSLQAMGHAVLAPDLRGHGDSTSIRGGGTLNAANMVPAQFGLMVTRDMDAVKRFLWDKNNEGKLNLNRLCIVGAEMGAMVAMDFTLIDWNTPPYGPLQLGQFVKAVVLISPEPSFKGLTMRAALANRDIRSLLAVYLIVGGEDPKVLSEAHRIYKILEPQHRLYGDDEQNPAKKTLFFSQFDTKLQGTKLLAVKDLALDRRIARFIEFRLVQDPDIKALTWKELKLPHQ